MRYFQKKQTEINPDTSHRQTPRGDLPLYAASLGNPIFVESWNGGSPLNWVEFMGRWETTQVRRDDTDAED